MGNSIGTGSLILTTNAAGLSSGLKTASGEMKGFASKSNGMLGGAFKGLAGGLKAGVVGLVAGFATAGITDMMEKIDNASKAARKLGTSTATFQGLQHAANLSGVSMEQLEVGLGKFRQTVTGPLDSALLGFAAELEEVEDPGIRAAMMVERFGKAGLGMSGLFEDGPDGLKKMIDEAEKLGLTVSDEIGKKMEETNDHITRVESAFKGMFIQSVAALGPLIDMLSNGLTSALEYLKPVIKFVSEYATEGFAIWGDILSEVWDVVKQVGKAVMDLVQPIFGFSDAAVSGTDVAYKVFKTLGIGVSYCWDILKAGTGIVAVVAGNIVKAFGYVVSAVGEAMNLLKELPEWARPPGVDKAIADFNGFSESVKQAGRDMDAWGRGAVENFGDSAKSAEAWFDKKRDERRKQDASDKGNKLKIGDNARILKGEGKDIKITGAIKNSKEDAEAIARFQVGNIVNPQMDVNKKQLAAQQQANKVLTDINKGIADMAGNFTFGSF